MEIEFKILDFLQGIWMPVGDMFMYFITKSGNAEFFGIFNNT